MNDASPSALFSCLSTTQRAILGLPERCTEEQLIADLDHITNLMKFDFYHYVGSFPIDDNANMQRVLSNLPATWRQIYASTDGSRLDPIAQTARISGVPIAWNESQFGPCEHENFYRTAYEHGIGSGVILPVHSRNGDAAVLGLFTGAERTDGSETIGSTLSDAGLTAMYLHDAVARVTAKARHAPKAPLTRREIECLHWIAHHKSNWAIAKILGISEHGAVYYVRRVMWKLDAQNRYQAVARATAYGLI